MPGEKSGREYGVLIDVIDDIMENVKLREMKTKK
jgi:hypothetical protein